MPFRSRSDSTLIECQTGFLECSESRLFQRGPRHSLPDFVPKHASNRSAPGRITRWRIRLTRCRDNPTFSLALSPDVCRTNSRPRYATLGFQGIGNTVH
jgi:hypothetical protein